ncbi:MAG TPA: translation elongation factor 4 [Bacilli bacterium]|nr:translation elongation factor 4 [Bacilli bacterium]
MERNLIRNFCIIAHIDHGKSTLADRILEATNSISKREMKNQLLDNMDLERERGITIKLNAVRLTYSLDGKEYLLNLIDTPGHVDFTYEVSRSLAACEGAVLVVDATQGIEAQTLHNLYLALEHDLKIIPVINKIDLPNADPEKVTKELIDNLGFRKDEIILCSAKEGIGIKELIEKIIEVVPAPQETNKKLEALIFDSLYDPYRGVVISLRVMNGTIKKGDIIYMMKTKATYEVTSVLVHTPKETEIGQLSTGEVGAMTAAIKSISDIKVGDTITLDSDKTDKPLAGYKEIKPMVFCGIYPIDSKKYEDLKEALDKLKLNDSSLVYEPETSKALGFGFRCGFLGLLHMEIIEERIEREYKIDLIATSPSVIYEVELTDGMVEHIDCPSKFPEKVRIKDVKEPYIKASIFTPSEYIGPIMELCQNKRGIYLSHEYIDDKRVSIYYELPLSEIVYDFYDKLKSATKGYASFDYEIIGYRSSELVKMDFLLNSELVDALSIIVHKDFAYYRGRIIVENLKKIIPRQMFEVPIQAAIGSKIIARSDVKAMRKDVLAKCYGGDVSRKKKLLEKQKEGKKRMKQIGSIEIPQEAFLSVLSVDENE